MTEDQLRALFAPYGDIVYVKIPPGKGCGFVQYVQRSAAEQAMQVMQVAQALPFRRPIQDIGRLQRTFLASRGVLCKWGFQGSRGGRSALRQCWWAGAKVWMLDWLAGMQGGVLHCCAAGSGRVAGAAGRRLLVVHSLSCFSPWRHQTSCQGRHMLGLAGDCLRCDFSPWRLLLCFDMGLPAGGLHLNCHGVGAVEAGDWPRCGEC